MRSVFIWPFTGKTLEKTMGVTRRLIWILVAFSAVPTTFVGALGYLHARTAIESVRLEGLNGIADLKVKKIREIVSRYGPDSPETNLRLEDIQQDTAGLGDTGEILVARKKGNRVFFIRPLSNAHPSLLGPLEGIDLEDNRLSTIRNAFMEESGAGRTTDYRGQPVLAAWRNIPGSNWALVIKIDLDEVHAPAVSLKTSVIILISVTLFMGVLITIAVSRTISTPILSLKNGVEIIGKGDFDYQINMKPSNEIGQLALAFNQMAKNLKSITASRDQLNREVEKRIQTEKDLGKRINELNCLFNLSKLIEQKGLSIEDVLRGTVDLIPSAFRHTQNIWAQIVFQNNTFNTLNFAGQSPRIRADIMVRSVREGALAVGLDGKHAGHHENVFFPQETELMEAIVLRLGRFIERRQAETALAASEKRFRDLVENSLTGISIVQNHQVVYQNKEQERLLGPLPRRYLLGNVETIHPDDVAGVVRFAEQMDSNQISSVDMDFRCLPDGMRGQEARMRWVQCRASRTEYKGEKAILINIMDITRTRQMEHMLRIQDKMASLGRVAAGIAHEIRNPLSGINIYINTLEKMLRKGAFPEKAVEILNHIQAASCKIESVIRRVTDFSRPTEPKFQMIDINCPVMEAAGLTEATLRKRGIRLETSLNPELPLSLADPHMMEEVILNLVNNAADAMGNMAGLKKISIATSVSSGHILISVSDSGPGIREPARNCIFDPFYTTKPDSTGIGLSICLRIIQDHDGVIIVRTGKLGGAEFIIRLPIRANTELDRQNG